MRILSFSLIFIFIMGCSQTNQMFSKRKTKGYRLPAQAAESKKGFTPGHIGSDLGTIKWSILSEKTFQKIHGEGWVLMDGRLIEFRLI